jgi:O-antigen ligase
MVLALGLLGARLKVHRVMQSVVLLTLPLAAVAPWGLRFIHERFTSAPAEIMTTRFEQWEVAWQIWLDNPFFGFGVGNYMEALAQYNFNWALELPVHNVALWIGAETGLFGLVSFFGVIAAAAARLWRITLAQDRTSALLALALLTALVAYVLDGLTDPLFREPVVFMMFWHIVALSVALTRITATPTDRFDPLRSA